MTSFFLLCDPAILLPPDDEDPDRGLAFWERLIRWSADRRVRLGPESLDLVHATFSDLGWPDLEPPGCPKALKHSARQALNGLLGRVRSPSGSRPPISVVPRTVPRHLAGELVEEAIGHDSATLCSDGLLGIATDRVLWEPQGDSVRFDPPPPSTLPLIHEPSAELDEEMDAAVGRFLRDRRLTIVGGWQQPAVVDALCHRFKLETRQVHWIPSERGHRLNLDALDGLQKDSDIVVCITGHIGHPGSEGVKARCRKREVPLRGVQDQGRIADDLQSAYAATPYDTLPSTA